MPKTPKISLSAHPVLEQEVLENTQFSIQQEELSVQTPLVKIKAPIRIGVVHSGTRKEHLKDSHFGQDKKSKDGLTAESEDKWEISSYDLLKHEPELIGVPAINQFLSKKKLSRKVNISLLSFLEQSPWNERVKTLIKEAKGKTSNKQVNP